MKKIVVVTGTEINLNLERSASLAHYALAILSLLDEVCIFFQSREDLFRKAGCSNLYKIHGNIQKTDIFMCTNEFKHEFMLSNTLREQCDMFIQIGVGDNSPIINRYVCTVKNTNPKAHTIEFNTHKTKASYRFDESFIGDFDDLLYNWVIQRAQNSYPEEWMARFIYTVKKRFGIDIK